jgi:hypothetical protein
MINFVMNILGGRGKYHDGLTATTYSSMPVSFGFLLLSMLYAIHPLLGMTIGIVIISITAALSLSIYFRALKEFYSTDMLTTLIGILIVFFALLTSAYISAMFAMGYPLFWNLR